jgi:multiple sugar transport system ATP-binding protein
VYVTHDQVEAMTMGDRIAVMNAGQLSQVGAPEDVYNNPRDLFTAGFIGSPSMNLVRGRLEPGDGDRMVFSGEGGVQFHSGLASSVPGVSLPARVVAGFRPEHVLLTPYRDLGAGQSPRPAGRNEPNAGGDTAPPLQGASGITAQVVLVEQLGREYIVHMEAGGQKLAAVATAGDPPEQGATVTAVPDPARLYFFDADSGARLGR